LGESPSVVVEVVLPGCTPLPVSTATCGLPCALLVTSKLPATPLIKPDKTPVSGSSWLGNKYT